MVRNKLANAVHSSTLLPIEGFVRTAMLELEQNFLKGVQVVGLKTGYKVLDQMTSGFSPGELIVIAGAPSIGKTAFALSLSRTFAISGEKKVAYFSLESSSKMMVLRMLATQGSLNLRDLRSANISEQNWPRLIQSAGELLTTNVFFDDSSPITPEEVASKCRELQKREGLDCVVIDYLQMMQVTNPKADNREREVGDISRSLKNLAKELNVPVVAISQLNRRMTDRTEKRPFLTDLRESGSIEGDADLILMLYRDDYYDRDFIERKGLAEVIVAKNRFGPTGTIRVGFNAETGSFHDNSPAQEDFRTPAPPSRGSSKLSAPGTLN